MSQNRRHKQKPDGNAGMHDKDFYLAAKNEHISAAVEYLRESGYASEGQAVAMLAPKGIR